MSLAQPNYDGLNKLDEKLLQLQKEVQFLEQEYGFSEEHINLSTATKKPPTGKNDKSGKKPSTSTTSASKTKTPNSKEKRYKNLPTVKVEAKEVPKKVIKPEIDQAWKDANKIKPDLMMFYNESVYQKKYVDLKDFAGKPISLKS